MEMINKAKDSKVVQILSSIILSVMLVLMVNFVSPEWLSNKKIFMLLSLLIIGTTIAGFFLKQVKWEEVFLYLFVLTSFLGASVLSINIGPFSIFPYRLFFILTLVLFFINLVRGRDQLYQSKVKSILLFLYVWLGYGLLSLLWAESVIEGVKYLILMFIGIALVTLVNVYLTNILQYLNLFYIWVFMTVVLLFIGLWNHLTQQHLSISTINSLPEHVQDIPTAVFVNQNDYASYLAISSFFFIAIIKYSRHHLVKLAGLGFLLLTLYLIFVTSSRASMLGLGIGLSLYLFLHLGTKLKKFIVALFGIIGSFVLILFSERIFSVINSIQTFDPQNMGSNEVRINLTKNAFHFITETYGFGVGAGNAGVYLEHYAKFFTRGIYKLHNWWLEIFATFGVFIFVGYVLMFMLLITSFYKFLKKSTNRSESMIAEALMYSLITFIPAALSPSLMANLFYHWVLLAFSIGYLNYLRHKPAIQSRVY